MDDATLSRLDAALAGPRPIDLGRTRVDATLRCAVLAPHPDDFDAIGIVMRRLHTAGHEIHVAVLTSGWTGVDTGWNGAETPAIKTALRIEEQRRSCGFFGLPPERLRFLELREDEQAHQLDDAPNHAAVKGYLADLRPHAVFLPHGNDSNIAHQRTYAMMRSAVALAKLDVRAFLNRDAKTLGMRGDAYVSFDADEARWKAELLRFHASQQARNLRARQRGFDDRVLDLNATAARELSLDAPYAEVFQLQAFHRGELLE